MSSHKVERKFDKLNSVFKDWGQGGDKIVKSCLANDFGWWKCGKMKMDPEDSE